MRALLVMSLATLMMSQAFAQEEAPLELGRPSATPIKIKRTPPPPPPSLDPPPQEPVVAQPKKVKKTKKVSPEAPSATATTTAPVPPPSAPPVTPPAPAPQGAQVKAPVTASPTAPPSPVGTPESPVAAPTPPPVAPPPVTPVPGKSPRKKSQSSAPAVAKSDNTTSVPALRHRSLLNFRFANIWAVRNRTNTGSFILGWDPVIFPWKRFNFGATLGVTQFESESVAGRGAEGFIVYEYGLSTSYYVSRVFLPELVIGGQMWNESGGSSNNLLVAFNANILFRKRPFKYLDRVYVGLGSLQMNGGSTNLFRAGLGVRF